VSIDRLRTSAQALVDWAAGQALPLWAERGFDRAQGRFEERLTMDGRLVPEVPIRLMVQARQIFCYAMAARRGWHPGGAALVETAFASMRRDYHHRDGAEGWVFAVHRDGTVADTRRDFYAHAFVLLAVASYVLVTRRSDALALADETLAYLDKAMRAPAGGYLDVVPPTGSGRSQNPHMHLFEGLLWLWSASGEPRYLARAGEIADLFVGKFFQPAHGVVIEHFDADLKPAPGTRGKIVEPGHHFEWAWLLKRFEQASGRTLANVPEALFDHADRYGYAESGLIFDEVLVDGSPHTTTHRLWPMTEAIKANVAMAAAGRAREEAQARAAALADRLASRFLTPAGGWVDRLDAAGGPATDFMPASSLYHLLGAIDELAGYAGLRTARELVN